MRIQFKKIRIYAAVAIAAVSGAVSLSFSDNEVYASAPLAIGNYTSEFNKAIVKLDFAAESYKAGKISIDSLREVLFETRISYKKIEFYLAFHYGEYVNEHINGAPLLHIEKSGTSPLVIQPEGLQILDELVFSDEAAEQKGEIAALAKKLDSHYGMLYKSINAKFKKEGDIAAMRIQLVRMYSMGLTGFDTPGSLNAISEAKASLEGMKTCFAESYPGEKSVLTLFDRIQQYLTDNSSFEELDRLETLKKYIDPLYASLGKIKGAGEPDFLKYTSAWNAESTSIFGNDFLNPYFFTNLKKDEDSDLLRMLGEALFYDPAISGDNNMSCASCHQPDKGFADGLPKSKSNVQGKTVLRNAPTLINAVYADRYFYDLRAFTLEQQAEHVIFNPDEFNTAYSAILKKLNGNSVYAAKFKAVFGKGDINRDKFTKALSSYVLSLRSFNSSFDKYIRGETSEISQEAKNGFNLFMGKANCATCHFAPTFAGLVPPLYNENETEILGVLADPKAKSPRLDTDEGRWGNSIQSEYAWIYEKSFKTSTVRNTGLTAPYFHNGAYGTLEEVVDFYNNGGGGGMGLNVSNQTLAAEPLNLTDKEKKELVAFMKSLDDVPAGKKAKR